MEKILACIFVAFLIGCAHSRTKEVVQGDIRISLPINKDPISRFSEVLGDGGTRMGWFTDAKGKRFLYYIDHGMGSDTPNAIYLNALPHAPGSVLIKNDAPLRPELDF